MLPPMSTLTIWSNVHLPEPLAASLIERAAPHRVVWSGARKGSNLVAGEPEPECAAADIAFGQPHPADLLAADGRVRWAHLSSAGWTRYDRPELRGGLASRQATLTTSSAVYAEPCAQHALALILAHARQIPGAASAMAARQWNYLPLRRASTLLNEQTAVLFGYGSIARRLAEMLAPLGMRVIGVRRSPRGDENIPIVPTADSDGLLPLADHVVNLLPAAGSTNGHFTAERFGRMKRSAAFYNIGRGTTVVQAALIDALRGGGLAAAYLDVTDPEPPAADDPIWTAPRCFITPHTAGGHANEHERLLEHFLANLRRFEAGQPLLDRVI